MKKISITLLAAVVLCLGAFAQKDQYIKPATLGVHFFFEDFGTPQYLVHNSIKHLDPSQWSSINRSTPNVSMSPGIGVDYLKGITRHIDFAAALNGSFVQYPSSDKTQYAAPTNIDPSKSSNQDLLADVTAALNFKLLSDKYILTPYLIGGVGVSLYQGEFGVFAPVGLGIQANIHREVYFFLTSQYRLHVTDNTADNLFYSLGVAGVINHHTKAPKALPVAVVPVDTDGDGVVDSLDKCPTVFGLASLQGCPDKDGDGIADFEDKCPDVAGVAKYAGCPIPDTDKDGINDELDKCPTVPGLARYNGCPIPDTDNDGVNDEEDKCPTVPGVASNFGCPVIAKAVIDKINYDAKNIFFATGSDKLLPKSFKSLTEVAKIMNEDKALKMAIDGYTDNTGKADKNVVLSQKRADAVKTFLVNKKVDATRFTSTGHGADKPLADNKTAKGRAKNRRVEMSATNY